ncbi:MAG TPA: bifunctional hydroxymethylpyrimidine kinase/phosphomethylpyrimidine kinase [Rubricoccaceae bacterium]|jgi:hydroxymethylpyrimidine/phosphomethylpyrimidine kinase
MQILTAPRRLAVVGGLYAGSERGLTADILVARALGFAPVPICTQLVMAGGGRVTDVTDVPTDTVAAQLDHTFATGAIAGVKVGILAGHQTAEVVLDACDAFGVPVVLDLVASGPSGETVLSAQGIDAVAVRLGIPRLVTISRADAELVTGGEIASLDDAQVAAQRIVNRGARHVVIRLGALPYRFYDAADDPGGTDSPAGPPPFSFDLAFDGEDFALFEAPLLPEPTPEGGSSSFAITALSALIDGQPVDEALQRAKRYATEALRQSENGLLRADWEAR